MFVIIKKIDFNCLKAFVKIKIFYYNNCFLCYILSKLIPKTVFLTKKV